MKRRFRTILRFAVFTLAVPLVFLSFSSVTFADIQNFSSSGDAYVQSGSPNANNGSAVVMDLNNTRDGVVRFDLSAIPSGSTINSATLTLVATAVGSATAVKNYGAHRILVNWVESTVTWNTPGSTAGTHFVSSPTQTIAVSATGSYNWDVTSDVANFVSGSSVNYGWRIIWSSNTSGTNKQVDFGTKENSTVSNRPVLTVNYTPSVAPDTTAPAAVSDLTLSNPLNSTITVSWTAPGDDGLAGTATSYDLRYSTSTITSGNFNSATAVAGEPVPSAAGSLESMNVTSLLPGTTYFFAIKTSDEIPNISGISNVPSLATLAEGVQPPSVPSGGGVLTRPTTVVFSGRAFPNAKLFVVDKDIHFVDRTANQGVIADENGDFQVSFINISEGLHSFGLLIKDKDNRTTQTKFFNINTLADNFVVKDILVPPTIGLLQRLVSRGQSAIIVGSASPKNSVVLEIDDIIKKEANVGKDGSYKVMVDTSPLEFGSHHARVKQIDAKKELESDYSPTNDFVVSRLIMPKMDLSGDGAIDIKDWSIFLSAWSSKDGNQRKLIDLNGDGKVDISDFSMFIRTIKK